MLHSLPPSIRHQAPPSPYWTSLNLIVADLQVCFNYVQPTKDHLSVYSHRLYELLLRSATEFESICKEIMISDSLTTKDPENLRMNDYRRLNRHFEGKPGITEVIFVFEKPIRLIPLANWRNGKSIPWYRDYNTVKHNRVRDFSKATLGNALSAIGALFILMELRGIGPPSQLTNYEEGGVSEFVKGNDVWPMHLKRLNK